MVEPMPETDLPRTDLPKTKLDIDWLRTLAGALAAVTSALLLSTLGAAGTIIGAALGSIAATIGTTVYAHGLARSKETVAKAQHVTLSKVGVAQAEVRRAGRRSGDDAAVEAHLEAADERLEEAKAELDEVVAEAQPGALSTRFSALPWKRIALSAAALFAAVLLTITAFEVLTGRSVSSRTGGSDDGRTTIGSVTRDSGRDRGREQPQPAKSPSPTPSDQASPGEGATGTPTETSTDVPTTPTEGATPTPTDAASEPPAVTPTPASTEVPTPVAPTAPAPTSAP
jgi:hypothetical protein